MSIITFSEVYEGIYSGRDPKTAEQGFRALLRRLDVLPISRTVARRNARLRGELRAQGQPVSARALDLLIAATALTHNLILVTRNLRDYRDIPGLQIYRES